MLTFSFFPNCWLSSDLVIAFCVYLLSSLFYAHHELVGFEDRVIWLFHMKDLLTLTGAGNKVLRVALGVASETSVMLQTR